MLFLAFLFTNQMRERSASTGCTRARLTVTSRRTEETHALGRANFSLLFFAFSFPFPIDPIDRALLSRKRKSMEHSFDLIVDPIDQIDAVPSIRNIDIFHRSTELIDFLLLFI